MCGIFGLVNGKTNRFANQGLCDLIRDALEVGQLRGRDSTGIFQIDKGEIYFHKEAIQGADFAYSNKAAAYIRDADTAVLTVGHHRAATKGKVSANNAHPFYHSLDNNFGRAIIGVHNGTLDSWNQKQHGCNVDSEWAIKHIGEKGLDAFKDFRGAFAFVWYEDSPEGASVLHMARNSLRPMYFTYVKDSNRMLFASEYMMLAWLAARNRVLLEEEFIELTPGYVYKFNVDNPRQYTTEPLPSAPVSQATSWNTFAGYKDRRTSLLEQIVSLFEEGEKEENSSSNEEGVKIIKREEVREARKLEVYKQEVQLEIDYYDAFNKEIYGTVEKSTNPDLVGVHVLIRGVSREKYKELQRFRLSRAKVYGVTYWSAGGEPWFVCSPMSVRGVEGTEAEKATSSLSSEEALSQLEAALREELVEHRKNKNAMANSTVH